MVSRKHRKHKSRHDVTRTTTNPHETYPDVDDVTKQLSTESSVDAEGNLRVEHRNHLGKQTPEHQEVQEDMVRLANATSLMEDTHMLYGNQESVHQHDHGSMTNHTMSTMAHAGQNDSEVHSDHMPQPSMIHGEGGGEHMMKVKTYSF